MPGSSGNHKHLLLREKSTASPPTLDSYLLLWKNHPLSPQQTSIIEKDKCGDYAKLTPRFVLPLKTHSVKRYKHPSDLKSISAYKEGGESEIILGALMGSVSKVT